MSESAVLVDPAGPAPGRVGLGELARRRDLLGTLVARQLRLRSKRSVMGLAWPVLAPLFLLALYGYVFGSVFEVPVAHYRAYLFAGLLPWTFFVQATHDALQSISFEPDLVRRAPFPYVLLPLARVVVMAIPFGLQLAGFVVVLSVSELGVRWELLPALAVPAVSLVLLVSAVAMLLALIDVFNRDLRFVLNNLLTVWFFLTPIVYHPRMASTPVRRLTVVDPMRAVIGQFRAVLYTQQVDAWRMALVLAVCAACFVVALALFRRWSVDLAKEV